MKHIQVEVRANEHQQEELIALLDELAPTGFEQTDETLKAYFEADHFDGEKIKKIIHGYVHTFSDVDEQNWNLVWEQNFQPVVVDDFCAVRAHFHTPIQNIQHEIIITPKMSFGTGHHATTYMMLQQMRHLDFTQKNVFDFGTGTGILAILAEKLGAQKVIAIDVDEWSIENAKENFERNDCVKIEVSLSTLLPNEKFDIILANINRNVILDYMPSIVTCVGEGGEVLFSGLLQDDENDIVRSATQNGLKKINKVERAGWISLYFKKQG